MSKSQVKSQSNLKDIILISLYIIYFLFMAKILFFKNVPLTEIFNSDREISRTLAIIPFQSIMKYYNSGNLWATVLNVVGNVVIFIPFGVFLMMYTQRKTTIKAVTTVLWTSVTVEVVQFVLDIGIADFDDITLNVLGGLFGVWTYKILKLIFKKEERVKGALITLVFVSMVIYSILLIYANSKGLRVKLI